MWYGGNIAYRVEGRGSVAKASGFGQGFRVRFSGLPFQTWPRARPYRQEDVGSKLTVCGLSA